MADIDNDNTPGTAGPCVPLLEMATIDVYALNPFRVLGADVEASIKDVQREQQRRAMQMKLGVATGSSGTTLFPISEEAEVQRAALEALARPIDRLLAELFWFSPDDGNALAAIAAGDAEGARAEWQAVRAVEPTIATHNLAVLHHALALGNRSDAGSDVWNAVGSPAALEHSALALGYWSAVADDEDFWHRLRERALAMDDRRLTTGLVRQIRRSLPTAVLAIHARIAHAAGNAGKLDVARAHVALIRESSFGERLTEDAIREALGPVRTRIKQAVEDAKARWASEPHKASGVVRELLDRGRDLLEVVDQMLPVGDPTRASLHDDVADGMLIGQVAYGRATDDWETSVDLLKLALSVVEGSVSREAIEKNLGIVESNTGGQNRWCVPGYWELPDRVLEPLEEAHAKARAGDYDGAIALLVAMEPTVGRPLYRAAGYALSKRGSDTRERAVGAFNAERGVIAQIMDKLRGFSDQARLLVLSVRPDPNQYAHQNPPCLACGQGYSSWVNLTYNDLPLFMCSTCSEKHDREQKQATSELRDGLTTALEYMLLAEELDPDDPDVAASVTSLKADAKGVDGRVPTTEALRIRLGTSRMHGHAIDVPSSTPSDLCHFCGDHEGDEASTVVVPMCGEVETTELLLGEGRSYRMEDVVVPRCSSCRQHHEQIREARERWQEEREDVGTDSAFPELLDKLAIATSVADRARDAIHEARQEQNRAEAAVVDAQIPNQCDRCSSDAEWDGGLCGACDAELFTTTTAERGLVAGLGLVAFANLFMGSGTVAIQGLAEGYAAASSIPVTAASGRIAFVGTALIVAIVALLFLGLSVRKRIERTELGAERLRAFAEANVGAAEAAAALARRAAEAVQAAERAAVPPEADRVAAMADLDAAKAAAQAEYESAHPWPELPPGVAVESEYAAFEVIATRVGKGWGFGPAPKDDGSVRTEPQNVTGLVA